MAKPLATIGIISLGDMGVGIARLLIAHNYRVITNVSGRSTATQARATANSIDLVDDIDLCNTADYVLSIVPPRDAMVTAERFAGVASQSTFSPRSQPLYYLDLNAISPRSAREIEAVFVSLAPHVRMIDGGILGGPPRRADDGSWKQPSIPTSGKHTLATAEPSGSNLANVLDISHVGDDIGAASGVKMCFAAINKGLTALAIQSFTTAQTLGILPQLQKYLDIHTPDMARSIEASVTGMPPKAYRWIREMEEIASTFEDDGGFDEGESIFRPITKVFSLSANGTELGLEKTDARKRGKTVEDVAVLMGEGLARRKVKKD